MSESVELENSNPKTTWHYLAEKDAAHGEHTHIYMSLRSRYVYYTSEPSGRSPMAKTSDEDDARGWKIRVA